MGTIFRRETQFFLDAAVGDQTFRHFFHPQHPIDHPGIDRGLRHAGVLGFFRILGDGQTAAFLDALQADCAIPIRARENHGRRVRSMRVRQRAEKQIHRCPAADLVRKFFQPEMSVDSDEVFPRRNDIHVIRLNLLAVLCLADRHGRRFRQDFVEGAFGIRSKMDDDDKNHPAIRRHGGEKFAQRRDRPR